MGAGSHMEKLSEVFRVQDRLEDSVLERAGTKQNWGRPGNRNHSDGSVAVRAWLVYGLVFHQLFLLSLQYVSDSKSQKKVQLVEHRLQVCFLSFLRVRRGGFW